MCGVEDEREVPSLTWRELVFTVQVWVCWGGDQGGKDREAQYNASRDQIGEEQDKNLTCWGTTLRTLSWGQRELHRAYSRGVGENFCLQELLYFLSILSSHVFSSLQTAPQSTKYIGPAFSGSLQRWPPMYSLCLCSGLSAFSPVCRLWGESFGKCLKIHGRSPEVRGQAPCRDTGCGFGPFQWPWVTLVII